jgi:hypothetical protein
MRSLLRVAYLLAGVATPGDEADSRCLKELHFVVLLEGRKVSREKQKPKICKAVGPRSNGGNIT